jgi:hypothetical protein
MTAAATTTDRAPGWRKRPANEITGTVYLIHFAEKIGNVNNPRAMAQHYLGFAEGGEIALQRRMGEHADGTGAKIMRAVVERGITWVVARTWRRVKKTKEQELKARKDTKVFCPICNGSVDTSEAPF